MIEKWKEMSNEELVLEYQQSKDNNLFEYFLNKNKNLKYNFAKVVIRKHPEQETDILACLDVAMWNAMLNYKSEFNCKFTTYLYYHFTLQLHLHWSNQFTVRLPRWVIDNYKVNLPKVAAKGAIVQTESIDEEVMISNKEFKPLIDILADPNPNPEEITESNEMRKTLKKYIKLLPAREAGIIIDYFGIDDGIPKTLQILGDKHGVTRERIRQIIAKGLKKLKRYLAKGTYGDLL